MAAPTRDSAQNIPTILEFIYSSPLETRAGVNIARFGKRAYRNKPLGCPRGRTSTRSRRQLWQSRLLPDTDSTNSLDSALPSATDTSFFGHPRGLATLFFTEMWERFSYYGMRALLILYMVAKPSNGGLGFDAASAAIIYGLYTSSVWLLSLPGGWIADRLLGARRAVLYGGILIAAGQF